MQVRSGIRAGAVGGQARPLDAALERAAAGASSDGAAGLDALFHTPLNEFKLWAERMNRKYSVSEGREGVNERYWELDMLRGLALSEMLLIHFIRSWLKFLSPSLFLAVFKIWQAQKLLVIGAISGGLMLAALAVAPTLGIRLEGGQGAQLAPWLTLGALIGLPLLALWLGASGSGAAGFLIISGMAAAVRHARQMAQNGADPFGYYLRRGAELFGWGVAVSALSLALSPNKPILFGILHLLGASTLLIYPFLALPAWANLAAALGVIGLGNLLTNQISNPAWLWLVIEPIRAQMFDNHPLLPWFGTALLGVALGKLLYRDGKRSFRMADGPPGGAARSLAWIGQNSLPIYLAQMPLTLAGVGLV